MTTYARGYEPTTGALSTSSRPTNVYMGTPTKPFNRSRPPVGAPSAPIPGNLMDFNPVLGPGATALPEGLAPKNFSYGNPPQVSPSYGGPISGAVGGWARNNSVPAGDHWARLLSMLQARQQARPPQGQQFQRPPFMGNLAIPRDMEAARMFGRRSF